MRLVRNQGGQIRKLQDKVEKLKEKLKATERAQSTEDAAGLTPLGGTEARCNSPF